MYHTPHSVRQHIGHTPLALSTTHTSPTPPVLSLDKGPAILIQDVSTIVVEPGCTATVTPLGDVRIEVGDTTGESNSEGRKRVGPELDPVYLSIFSHRFMGIAEQMGRTLQVRVATGAVR